MMPHIREPKPDVRIEEAERLAKERHAAKMADIKRRGGIRGGFFTNVLGALGGSIKEVFSSAVNVVAQPFGKFRIRFVEAIHTIFPP